MKHVSPATTQNELLLVTETLIHSLLPWAESRRNDTGYSYNPYKMIVGPDFVKRCFAVILRRQYVNTSTLYLSLSFKNISSHTGIKSF